MFTYLHVVLATHLPLQVVWLLGIKAREKKTNLKQALEKENTDWSRFKNCILNYLQVESHSTRLIKKLNKFSKWVGVGS